MPLHCYTCWRYRRRSRTTCQTFQWAMFCSYDPPGAAPRMSRTDIQNSAKYSCFVLIVVFVFLLVRILRPIFSSDRYQCYQRVFCVEFGERELNPGNIDVPKLTRSMHGQTWLKSSERCICRTCLAQKNHWGRKSTDIVQRFILSNKMINLSATEFYI
jgi:hypothetical protein